MEKDISTDKKFIYVKKNGVIKPYDFVACGCACKVCDKQIEYLNNKKVEKKDIEKNT